MGAMGHCYGCYRPPWDTAMGAMGHCYGSLWVLLATAGGGMGAMCTLGHYGLLLWVLWAAMCAMGHCYGCHQPLLWAAMCAMDHCYGYYGLLWATAMGYMPYCSNQCLARLLITMLLYFLWERHHEYVSAVMVLFQMYSLTYGLTLMHLGYAGELIWRNDMALCQCMWY